MSSDTASLGLNKGRVEALSDGIFATVMTVLVLTLSVPVITGGTPKAVTSGIEGLAPNVLSYVMSFLLLAVMWVSHHNVFHYLKKVDRPMLWLNIAFLLSIGFVPLSTALLGRYPLLQLPIVVYGANVVGIAASMLAFLSYGTRVGLFEAEGSEVAILRRIVSRWRLGIAIYAAAIVISLVSTVASFGIYVAVLVFFVLQSALGYRTPTVQTVP